MVFLITSFDKAKNEKNHMTHIDVRPGAPFSLINFLFSIIKFHFVEKFGFATTKGRTESRGLFVGRKMFKLKKFSLRHFQPAQCTDLKTKSHKIRKKATSSMEIKFFSAGVNITCRKLGSLGSSTHKIFCVQFFSIAANPVQWILETLQFFSYASSSTLYSGQ